MRSRSSHGESPGRKQSMTGLDIADDRVAWLAETVYSHFRNIKADRFQKFISGAEWTECSVEFADKDFRRLLLVWEKGSSLTVSLDPPKAIVGNTLYVLKLKQEALSMEGFVEQVIVGDMTEPLRHLRQLTEDVYEPLLSNPQNQEGWSEVVRSDVMETVHSFLSDIQITIGQTTGDTALPLPTDDDSRPGTTSKDRAHVLEGCLITWTKQIKDVLKLDPEKVMNSLDYPGPLVEIEFWDSKAANLNSIFKQLQGDRVRKVLRYLDAAKSTYNAAFAKLCREVFHARTEANDTVRFLAPLVPWLERLETESDFVSLTGIFRPTIHSLMLVWIHSRFYNTPARIVVLVREICNTLVRKARQFVSGEVIFDLVDNDEPQRGVEMLMSTLRVCGVFKSTYFDYKAKVAVEAPHNPWRVQNSALFGHLDAFLERCHDIREFTSTIVQFSKLAKIEIGGTKGKTLTTSVAQIFTDFSAAVAAFKEAKYDIMDVDAKAFDDDFYEFRVRVKELERRLASVLTQSFDDTPTILGRFKLLDSFEGLLERPLVRDELERKHQDLLASYLADLTLVQTMFADHRERPPIAVNLPPIAGSLSWCRGLLQRIQIPMEKLKQLSRSILDREEAKPVVKLYVTLVALMAEYEHHKIEEWGRNIERSSQAKLKLPLLFTDSRSGLLRVNFDPALVRLLREVKYFLLLGLRVPESALAIYKKAETFRKHTGNLDLIVNMYNNIQTVLLPVERPLMKPYLAKVDKALAAGLKSLNWKSHGIDLFITEAMNTVRTASDLLNEMTANLKEIQRLLDSWSAEPLFLRRAKPLACEAFNKMVADATKPRFRKIHEDGRTINKLLKDTNRALKVSQGMSDWRNYVDFVSNIVIAGIRQVVLVSLKYLREQLDEATITREAAAPIVEVELDLFGKDVRYMPDIASTGLENGVRDNVMGWIGVIFKSATMFARLDLGSGSYLREMLGDPDVQWRLMEIDQCVRVVEDKCAEVRKQFTAFDYLWVSDSTQIFNEFIEKAHAYPPEEDAPDSDSEAEEELKADRERKADEAAADAEAARAEGVEQAPPPVRIKVIDLAAFDAQITKYSTVQDAIRQLKHSMDVVFVRVDAQPIKQALSTWVTKWNYMFTLYLHKHVMDKLRWLHEFTQEVEEGLNPDVTASEEDREALMAVIAHICDVSKIMDQTFAMFEPLKEVVSLLKKHGDDFRDEKVAGIHALEYLEDAQIRWENTVNHTFKVKEAIRPHQNQMADNIKLDIGRFGERLRAFRLEFQVKAPFGVGSVSSWSEAYAVIDSYQNKLAAMEAEAAEFRELEELFELQQSEHEDVYETREELVVLKSAWDMWVLVDQVFGSWSGILWNEIKADDLLDETKKLMAQIRNMPAKARAWPMHKELTARAKNMSVVLPLVSDLRSPAMRDRHWKELFKFTGKAVEKDHTFCLHDVLTMDLHVHVEEVRDLVEVANKELKIEQRLRNIEDLWSSFELVFLPYKELEDMATIQTPDEAIENLEEHMMQLQTMAGMGKFVEYFRTRVDTWQQQLSNVDTVLMLWLNVQRQWCALEAIFLGSADIRSQLPEDSKRFEAIDQDFKDLMKEAMNSPNIVDACGVDGRDERLRNLLSLLEVCQKALNEYLDAKKKLFPRFYFVSNAALLDILSNGKNPTAVMPHVGACFDAIRALELKPSSEPEEGKEPVFDSAAAMLAKDGEVVPFMAPYLIHGAVEVWLGALVSVIQDNLKEELYRALDSAGSWESDQPREEWVANYPAQIALLASQIVWTEETEGVLEDAESGQEESVKTYLKTCVSRLEALIKQVLTPLDKNLRIKIITLITIDVHSRDVVQRLVDERTSAPTDFLWQQQLRYYWQEASKDCVIRITDFRTWYCYEYIGNVGRLVITPLTDRCYITLTMAMRLMLGGAPAGPAGTGKTETTKDLARGLGLPCYVFNCSDQMNYQTMADIFKGLSQTGAWGCFDEFNRIPIEVLSVVATQVETVLGAIRFLSLAGNRPDVYKGLPDGRPPAVVGEFEFMGDRINLVPTVGFFITMNPGYAGRTELPENLKALFRSCAMIRPDLALICENMLMSEGFVMARPLSVKFVTLYQLSSELLSPQAHYDWGLRAVKSVLRVAGMLKRAEPDQPEEAVLMRALRDFNTPKVVLQDTPIFLRLVRDLFPGVDLDPKVNESLRSIATQVCKETGLQAEDSFLLKVEQYQELLDVRHSVMLVGPAGAGKTSIWKALMGCINYEQPSPIGVFEVVNPKSVTSDELYGFMTLARDWKDGILSTLMRNMSKNSNPFKASQTTKWVVLDGDIDAEWIESMNTVMDDNKVLTLVSNERIPLSDAMRMVFEIESLANATPATVSRAGILYINESDIGWKPLVESWAQRRKHEMERAIFPRLFRSYVDKILDLMRLHGMKHVTPLSALNMVHSTCRLLDGLLASDAAEREAAGIETTQELLEYYFVFAAMWAFGGGLTSEPPHDYRKQFNVLWRSEFKTIKFPDSGHILDYYFVPRAGDGDEVAELLMWADQVGDFVPTDISDGDTITVPTVDSVRMTNVLAKCVDRGVPVCLVGPAGTGKTLLVREYLDSTPDSVSYSIINMNYYTDAKSLQLQLESSIDKRSGRIYGPPGNTRHVYFVDDLNMPFVEKYGTQTPIALLRQLADHRSWFDRDDLGLKREIRDVQLVAAMNPKSGSFVINPRLQRHFFTLAVMMPEVDDLNLIYRTILEAHLVSGFNNEVMRTGIELVNATVALRAGVAANFLPSAIKFHYNFNMRDLARIFSGLTLSVPAKYQSAISFVRLWLHECERVFSDRLVSDKDITRFNDLLQELTKKHFDLDPEEMFAKPNLYTSFVSPGKNDEPEYTPIADKEVLHTVLSSKLKEYNDNNSIMNLVLFDQAMEHVCRITRIIQSPRGNALLVGVGGSGKQSLCKLAAWICGYTVMQLPVSGQFGVPELKECLKDMYKKAGVKPGEPIVFLLTDSHILDEKFLVFLNDLLSSGVIPDLFAPDEFDGMFAQLRSAAKAAGIPDSRQHMMEFFIDRVRRNLHVVLAFSPVGEVFRARARKFPALITCTSIDWFHPWPRDALVSVAASFMKNVELADEEIRENISHHMAEVHMSVTTMSETFFEQQRRNNYVTPKSFLELISFYKSFLSDRRAHGSAQVERLSTGLSTLRRTAEDVAQLQTELQATMVRVAEKKEATEALLEQMGKERGEAEQQAKNAGVEREKANKAAAEASKIEEEASGELAVAKPALEEAKHAVDCLSKASLTELKSLTKPPSGVDKVTMCCLIMLKNEKRNFSWDNAKKMMAKIDQFKGQLEQFKAETMPDEMVYKLQPICEDPNFDPAKMASKSSAAANLASWVVNSVRYNRIYKKVEPLMIRLDAAKAAKAEADAALNKAEGALQLVEERLAALQAKFLEATDAKTRVEEEAAACEERLNLAERLVNGLSSENERWGNEVHHLKLKQVTLVGDVLLAAAFVSYVGAFDQQFRELLWKNEWLPDLKQREVPLSEGVDPLLMLSNDASQAEWMNQGLPADRMSLENGAIITNSKRWPLLIDPQLQGISWLRSRGEADEDRELMVLRTSQRGWMRRIIGAVTSGAMVILENLGESIDSALDPILTRNLVRRGKSYFLRIGDEDVEFDPSFRLYLQTKLINPHYKPEIQAQCTMVNFIVTQKGLEDQLLAHVVAREQPELEEEMMELQQSFNRYKIQLLALEDQLLERLANAPDDILSDVPLIQGLEATKAKVTDINEAVERGKEAEESIMEAREVYRPVAAEGSLLYFILIQLDRVAHMYQFSLGSFVHFFFKAMDKAEMKEDDAERVVELRDSVRITIFTWAARGLFEAHKLIFLTQLVFQLLRAGTIGEGTGFEPELLDFLVRGASVGGDDDNDIAWLPDSAWNAACALSELDQFSTFASDLASSAPRFLEWFNHVTPETEKLPLDWRELDKVPFQKLLVLRCLRPDRMAIALQNFIESALPKGRRFTEVDARLNAYNILEESFDDSSPETPIYFILSPGSDVVSDMDRLARAAKMEKGVSYFNISLGQGQDIVAMRRLEVAVKEGHWVLLNNVHLMPRWLVELEKVLDQMALDGGIHDEFRLFLSSDPSSGIPVGLLSRSIKLTDEPPTGLKANLKRALSSFSAEEFDEMDSRTRGMLFGLCHFHAIMLERKKFGAQGFNMMYPFASGDLLASAVVLRNYMESAASTPWADLRYLFGQIMYGGHIVNDFDRLLCMTYLEYFMRDELLDELEMFPYVSPSANQSFKAPSPTGLPQYLEYIDEKLTTESPLAFGMHPNAEIGFRTENTRQLFMVIQELQPADSSGGEGAQSIQHVAGAIMQDLLEEYRDWSIDVENVRSLMDEPGPYQTVFLQECEAMNGLVQEIVRSLAELELGIQGELTMSEAMETLMQSLFMDRVPDTWAKRAYPSMRPLGAWLSDLVLRREVLTDWTVAPMDIPRVAWLGGFFNPQSFLTAIMQTTAQRDELELDKLVIVTEVTRKKQDEIEEAPRDGAFIAGLKLEGCRYDVGAQVLEDARPKELFCEMPVINCHAVLPGKEPSGVAPIPVYRTQQRGPTYIFTAQVRTKSAPGKWVLAGVAMVLEVL